MKFIDRTGKVYSRLTVVELSKNRSANNRMLWVCKCECGNVCEVRGSDLTTERVKSCGCFRIESTKNRSFKHGKSKNYRLYQTWQNMKKRCMNPNANEFENYGGRGISVCDEWCNSFEVFEKWAIMTGYNSQMTIDRINVGGNYEPNNCQWLTKSENCRKAHNDRGGKKVV